MSKTKIAITVTGALIAIAAVGIGIYEHLTGTAVRF